MPGMIVGGAQEGTSTMFSCLPNGDFAWNKADADPIEQRWVNQSNQSIDYCSELSDKFGGVPPTDGYVNSSAMPFADRPYNYQPTDDVTDLKGAARAEGTVAWREFKSM